MKKPRLKRGFSRQDAARPLAVITRRRVAVGRGWGIGRRRCRLRPLHALVIERAVLLLRIGFVALRIGGAADGAEQRARSRADARPAAAAGGSADCGAEARAE